MTTFTALALDPGGTTGWSSYRAQHMNVGEGDEWYEEEWDCGHIEYEGREDLITLLELQRTEEYYVICERYKQRPLKIGAKNDLAPLVEAEITVWCTKEKVPLFKQDPGQAKPFVKDSNIKKMGLWVPGWRHAMDARRHLLFWLINGKFKRQDLLTKGWK